MKITRLQIHSLRLCFSLICFWSITPTLMGDTVVPDEVVAWGSNTKGQLTPPTGLSDVMAIAAGGEHNLALLTDGTVVGWGANDDGQATPPSDLSDVTAIAAGGRHSLAIRADGTVVGWGDEYFTPPADLSNVTAIAAGGQHSLALRADGTIAGWGEDGFGQATPPPGLSSVVAIAAGHEHSLALLADGTVVGWGWNEHDQATPPEGLTNVVAIAAGMYHSLALRNDGTVVGWGYDGTGQVTPPYGLADVVAIAAGSFHSLALQADGTVVGWGPDWWYGHVTPPADLSGVAAIAAGREYSLALRGEIILPLRARIAGKPFHFLFPNESLPTFTLDGSDSWGEITHHEWTWIEPDGTPGSANGSVLEVELPLGMTPVTLTVTTADDTTAATTVNVWVRRVGDERAPPGEVVAWGLNSSGQGLPPADLSYVVGIAAGSGHSLALRVDGTVAGWGADTYGQATPPADLSDVVAVAAGGSHSLALRSDGTVVGWGGNWQGQAWHQAGLSDVVAIAAGEMHSLALRANGTVVAWGRYLNGEAATPPAGLSDVVAIATGYENLAMRADGTVVGWGPGGYNQVTPTEGLTNVMAIAAGGGHSLALQGGLTLAPLAQITGQSLHFVPPGQNLISVTLDASNSWGEIAHYSWTWTGPDGTPRSATGPLFNADMPQGRTPVTLTLTGADDSIGETTVNVWVRRIGGEAAPPGEVVVWGINSYAEPQEPIMDAIAVAAGMYSGYVALRADGSFVGWGGGIGNVPNDSSDVVAIVAGWNHCLALRADGTVAGWGANADGQATPPAELSDVVAIAAGDDHSLALRVDGTVVGWGNEWLSPPEGLSDVVAIAAGGYHSLALRADGTVVGWGNNWGGQATPPIGLTNVVAIAAGDGFSAALQTDGNLRVWGYAMSFIFQGAVIPDAVDIVAGGGGLVAIADDGSLHRFGGELTPELSGVRALAMGVSRGLAVVGAPQNTFPILVDASGGGTVTVTPQKSLYLPGEVARLTATPLANHLFTGWSGSVDGNATTFHVTLSPGFAATAQFPAIDLEAEVVGWGANNSGQALSPPDLSDVVAIAASTDHNLALRSDGTVVGWGADASGQATPPAGLSNVIAISTGWRHSLALRADGSVVGWGSGSQAVPPVGLSDATAIAAGGTHSLALRADGTVVGWGGNHYGQATPPVGLSNVVSIAAGFDHSLVLQSDGTVVAWGRGQSGQGAPPVDLSDVTAISAGSFHNLALRADGTVVLWGSGGGSDSISASLSNIVSIAGGASFSIALKADGTVVAWGMNDYLQATPPDGLSNVVAIAAGGRHGLALRSAPQQSLLDAFLAERLADFPESLRGWMDDANSNGVPNLIEYARGTDPGASGVSTVWPLLAMPEENEGPELSVILRVDDPALDIVCEVSGELAVWSWVLRHEANSDEWEFNTDLVEMLEWRSLGDGMQEARMRSLTASDRIFVRMAVDYKPGE